MILSTTRAGVVTLPLFLLISSSDAWVLNFNHQRTIETIPVRRALSVTIMAENAPKAGTFFNPVPENNGNNNNSFGQNESLKGQSQARIQDIEERLGIMRSGSDLSKPDGFKAPSKQLIKTPSSQKSFIGIGPTLNDVTKPEYDEQGYTLYADEQTGVKSRVFEALVEYPCIFTMKIVGSEIAASSTSTLPSGNTNNSNQQFVNDILGIVAESCEVSPETTIQHSIRQNGKWTSITVQAPVKSATMLYQLYENVDRDPRVKFKF